VEQTGLQLALKSTQQHLCRAAGRLFHREGSATTKLHGQIMVRALRTCSKRWWPVLSLATLPWTTWKPVYSSQLKGARVPEAQFFTNKIPSRPGIEPMASCISVQCTSPHTTSTTFTALASHSCYNMGGAHTHKRLSTMPGTE